MQKAILLFVFSLSLVVLTGCPFGSIYNAGSEKKALLVKGLTGTWVSDNVGFTEMKITDLLKNTKGYQLRLADGSTYDALPIDTLYSFYVNKVGGLLIASVKERAEGGKYFFFKLEQTSSSELTIWEVDENKFDKEIYTSENEFRKALETKLKDKDLFINKKVWKRKP